MIDGETVTHVTVRRPNVRNQSPSGPARYAGWSIDIKRCMTHSHPFRRLGAMALIAVAALPLTTACSGDKPAADTAPGPEPKTIAGAKTAAQTVFDRFSGGDYAGAWDMYTTAGKRVIKQADYVKLNAECSRKGLAIVLSTARMDGADKAIVVGKQLAAMQSYTMVYETNAWKLEPAKEGLALYAGGAAKAIAAQKKAGTCATE
jgi:hypothetical protein